MRNKRFPYAYTRHDNALNKEIYFYEVSLGTDPITGKRSKQKSTKDKNGNKFTSLNEAHIEAVRIMSDFHQNNCRPNSNKSYKEYMEEDFIPYYKRNNKAQTLKSKQSTFKKLIERFGKIPLKNISTKNVEDFKTFLIEETRYSRNYASSILSTFHHTLEQAVISNFLNKNVAYKIFISKEDTIFTYWTQEEVQRVLLAIDKTDYFNYLVYTMVHFYFYTGLRVNETTALFWEDIDFDKKEVRVHSTMVRVTGKKPYRQDCTKTKAGERTIALDVHTIEVIRELKARQHAHRINSDFVFSDSGKPLYSQRIAKRMNIFATKANVEKITLQRLRPSHAMYLYFELGVKPQYIIEQLGQRSEVTLFKHYIGKRKVRNNEIAQRIDESTR